eukprot:TRINITY_DN2152_c0_g1_i1.p1 TRINITY_DN2152_c0_g1~~TRINITY_DN2152_c0_g1_i1.p1  ORF type:complete len:1027 (+),score=171.68 TRINITY_DN2152_c0_g1_i1:15-3095(+)
MFIMAAARVVAWRRVAAGGRGHWSRASSSSGRGWLVSASVAFVVSFASCAVAENVTETTTSVPEISSSVPETSSSVPGTTSSVPETTSSVPETSSSVLGKNSSVLVGEGHVTQSSSLASVTTTASAPSTSSTSTTDATAQNSVIVSDNSQDVVIIAISASVGGVILLVIICSTVYSLVVFRQKNVAKQLMEIRALETREADVEIVRRKLVNRVDLYVENVSHLASQGKPLTGDVNERHDAFMARWQKFCSDHTQFCEFAFAPELNRRRAADAAAADAASKKLTLRATRNKKSPSSSTAQPPVQVVGSSADQQTGTTLATDGSNRVCDSSGVTPLRARGGHRAIGEIWPRAPVTPAKEVQRQFKQLEQLNVRLGELCTDFSKVWDAVVPSDVGSSPVSLALQAESSVADFGAVSYPPSRLDDHAKLLVPITHPLLNRVKVQSFGVLGASEGELGPSVGSKIDAVIVDPAGWHHIGPANSPKGAAGAAGAIYQWLGLKKTGAEFPPEVRSRFNTPLEMDAETLAKYHAYGEGQHVIHVVGPKITDFLDGFRDLSVTYCEVLTEFCEAIRSSTSTTNPTNEKASVGDNFGNHRNTGPASVSLVPKVLRLLPVSSGIFLHNRKLEKHMAEITWGALAVSFMMLPPALQDVLKDVSIEVCLFKKHEFVDYHQSLKKKQELVGTGDSLRVGDDQGRVNQKRGAYDWVRNANGPDDRLKRVCAALQTAHAIHCGGYTLGAKVVKLAPLKEMIDGTQKKFAYPLVKRIGNSGRLTKISRDEHGGTVMDVAIKFQGEGKRTVAVNAASAFSLGGGVLYGGRHALEESWCTMSTLLPSLQSINSQHDAGMHIPVDGCIFSPGVEIFRETSVFGYGFQASTTKLQGVCSVAMFNMNPRVSDSPLDAPRDFVEYCTQVKNKFRAILNCAAEVGAEVLVCPDVGCGVFGNDPKIVGSLMGEAVLEQNGVIEMVVLTGKPNFGQAAMQAFSGAQVACHPPAYFVTKDKEPIARPAPSASPGQPKLPVPNASAMSVRRESE